MKISHVHIKGYRCLADLKVDFDDLTAFVGSGGVGKSTILNALDWFFHGGELQERDLHRVGEDVDPAREVVVAVTFKDLNNADRAVLGAYVQGSTTTLTRSWTDEEGQKLSGNALVFPEFEKVRVVSGARELRKAYVAVYEEKGEELDLPAPARGAEEVKTNMEIWERENPNRCEMMAADARHLGGFTGTPLLASRFDYVLVSATAGAPEALSANRGSVLEQLLSVVEELDEESRLKIEQLQGNAQDEIEVLVSKARGAELVSISSGVTKRVQDYFPGAAVKLEDEVAAPRPPQISVRARVSDRGGYPIDPDLQGHGLQRALVIALLHELAESELKGPAEELGAEPRTLMLAIEEPELYQHPLQARALAASLENLVGNDGGRVIQVAYSTHSPYFTRPVLFADLRLCRRLADGRTSCVSADPDAISAAIESVGYGKETATSVEKALAESLREAIFARSVLLCEGDTDAAVLEGLAETQGGLDAEGVAVAPCGTKAAVIIAIAILSQLDIPLLALFDADAAKQDANQAKRNRQILELCEEKSEDWPQREIRDRSANFEDELEADLASLWPDFDVCRERVAAELGVKPGKKDDRVYRQAAAEAADPPQFVLDILERIRVLAAS
jgi:hypothetical protein